MKRELKEHINDNIIIDITDISQEFPQTDFNAIRDELIEIGADVKGDTDNVDHILMIVSGVSEDEIAEIFDNYNIPNVSEYFNDYLDECGNTLMEDDEFEEYPSYDSVEINENEELRLLCYNALQKAYDMDVVSNESEIDENMYELIEEIGDDPDELSDEEYDEIVGMFHNVWPTIDFNGDSDIYDDEDDIDEPTFEKIPHRTRLNEKRKSCCPPKRTINLYEALKAFNEEDAKKLEKSEKAIKEIIKGTKAATMGELEAKEALKKLKAENAKLNKIKKDEESNFNVNDVQGAKSAMKNISNVSKELEAEVKKFEEKLKNKVLECLKSNKNSLHESIKINGKSLSKFSVKELKAILEKLYVNVKSLNESKDADNIDKKKRLMEYIDQEITYRVVRNNYLNEDEQQDNVISDEELSNLFGPGQGEENKESSEEKNEESDKESSEETSEENSNESDEEVELSRIVITLKDKDAAEALKQACIDAEIPEEAIEIKEDSDDEAFEEEPEEPEEPAEGEESTEEESEEEAEEPNESIRYKNIRSLLFEGEEPEEPEEPAESEESEEPAEGEEPTEEESEESEENDSQYKFILVNTDYAEKLAKVLDDNYGISREEFEEQIGGEIVSEDDNEETTEEDSDKEEKAETEEKSDKDDEIDTSDLFAGL